jgi:hypothetical protein
MTGSGLGVTMASGLGTTIRGAGGRLATLGDEPARAGVALLPTELGSGEPDLERLA